jgi:hypothetical protein
MKPMKPMNMRVRRYHLGFVASVLWAVMTAAGCQCTRGPAPKVAAAPSSSAKAATTQAEGEHAGGNPHSPHNDVHGHAHDRLPDGTADNAATQAPLDDHHVFAGGLTWKAPREFLRQPPKNEMRAAEYVIRGERDERAELTVYFFGADQGGSTQSNIDRWIAQFSPQGRQVRRFTHPIATLQATGVEIHGTYLGMAMPGEPPPTAAPNHTMVAVVVIGPEGPVFFKWTGPSALVKRHRPQLDALLDSVRPIPR